MTRHKRRVSNYRAVPEKRLASRKVRNRQKCAEEEQSSILGYHHHKMPAWHPLGRMGGAVAPPEYAAAIRHAQRRKKKKKELRLDYRCDSGVRDGQ